MRAYNVVLCTVVTRRPLKDTYPDVLLSRLFRSVPEGTVGDIKKKIPELRRRLKVATCRDALDKHPMRMPQRSLADLEYERCAPH